jgi:sigma-B regulation protein RsbU (phosphoserine phosphatase)
LSAELGPADESSQVADLEDLFEHAPCGYLSTDKDGRISRANTTLARWLEVDAGSLVGRRFSDLLTIGGRIYYETHLAPLLRMQGSFDEIAVDLVGPGGRVPVLVNAVERRNADGSPLFVRVSIFKATGRRSYERNLLEAKENAERAIRAEREARELREQFIAVLGHDLRNPLASLAGGVRMLGKEPLGERATKVLKLMDGSIVRAGTLIENVLDFARSRLGTGIGLVIDAQRPLEPTIQQVVDELQSIAEDRQIIAEITILEPVEADHGRIGQLVSNLLGNAITHGAPDRPITVDARTEGGTFELSVANGGAPIPDAAMARLFQPFFRGSVRPSQHGLGLGLHIASEIAKAHGGEIGVVSDEAKTRFTFRMPCRRADQS